MSDSLSPPPPPPPPLPPRHVLYYEQEEYLRHYCIAHMSVAMCKVIAFPPPIILFSFYQYVVFKGKR